MQPYEGCWADGGWEYACSLDRATFREDADIIITYTIQRIPDNLQDVGCSFLVGYTGHETIRAVVDMTHMVCLPLPLCLSISFLSAPRLLSVSSQPLMCGKQGAGDQWVAHGCSVDSWCDLIGSEFLGVSGRHVYNFSEDVEPAVCVMRDESDKVVATLTATTTIESDEVQQALDNDIARVRKSGWV